MDSDGEASVDKGQRMLEQLQAGLVQCQRQAEVLTEQQKPHAAGGALGRVLEADLRQAAQTQVGTLGGGGLCSRHVIGYTSDPSFLELLNVTHT